MKDPTGKLLVEIRDDATVAAITTRIRAGEPAQGDVPPFVVIRRFPITPFRRALFVPVAHYQYLIGCYGITPQQASQLAGAVADVVQNPDRRTNASGVGIYNSYWTIAGQAQIDPDTKWAFETVIGTVNAATVEVEEVAVS